MLSILPYLFLRKVSVGSLYTLMAAKGLSPYIAERTFRTDRPVAREAKLLKMRPDAPGLRLVSTTFDSMGLPVEYTEAFFYDFQVTLRVAK